MQEILRAPTLIICPAYLIPTWQCEIKKLCEPGLVVDVFDKGNMIYEVFDSDIVITSYNLAQKAEHLFAWAKFVVMDEAHELKSMDAKRTSFIHRCIYENSVPRVSLLTGTPIKNRVMEYYSLMALCNYNPTIKKSFFLEKYPDAITFADHFSFRTEYTLPIGNKRVKVVKWDGLRNKKELKHWLKDIYFRVRSEDVLELERPLMKDILISNSEDISLLNEFNNFFEDEENQSVGPSKKVEAAVKKVPFTYNYVQSLMEERDCAVIYTDSVDACEALAEKLGVDAITGKMPIRKRKELEERFQRGEIDFIVATIKSFSQGIDLTRSKDLIFNDYPWVPGDMDQAIFRIQRRNQTERCTIHKIFGSPQDRYIEDAINEKREVIGEIT